LPDEIETIGEVFGNNGYTTAAFVTNPFLKKIFNLKQGFDYYCDDFVSYTYLRSAKENSALPAKLIAIANAMRPSSARERHNTLITPSSTTYDFVRMGNENVNSDAVKWVKRNLDHPFFLYLHYIDVHGPYPHPRLFDADLSGSKIQKKINLYDGALRYMDSQIGALIEGLERLGVLDNAIVIITSDHGEEFREHGGMGHGANLFEEQLQIPLVFLRTSAFPYNKKVTEAVGLVDILPTLIDYLKLDSSAETRDGRSFVGSLGEDDRIGAPKYQYAETELTHLFRSVVSEDRWKMIYSEETGVRQERLYNLSEDPAERVNLIKERQAIASELREELAKAFSNFESRSFSTDTVEPSEQTRQLLKAVGYLE
jgi:arylsulfatase